MTMLLFLGGCVVLILGYLTYGRWIESVFRPDDRDMPSKTHYDGVDFMVLPHWKNMLIQLLNIAGVGPVIGVILGIKFGPIVFIIIPIGNIIGGAVHDYLAGMMSARSGGANLPRLVQENLGNAVARLFGFVTLIALLLVVAVFINTPAALCCSILNDTAKDCFIWISLIILLYYTLATLFPIDQIIGRIYPFFGGILIVGTFVLFGVMIYEYTQNPAFLNPTEAFRANMFDQPIIPMLFVTIACGIISGFHATQAPIVARTQSSEHQGRQLYYGMMILEGVIGMIWAAVGLAIYNIFPELMKGMPMAALVKSTEYYLGDWVSILVVLGVIILAITSGDTAMRSLRLTLAEMLHYSQKPIRNRLVIVVPLLAITAGLLVWSNKNPTTFNYLWNYFAWMNQVMATFTLMMASVWLFQRRRCGWATLLPGAFMCFVVTSFILWTCEAVKGPYGCGLPLNVSYWIAGAFTALIVILIYRRGHSKFIEEA